MSEVKIDEKKVIEETVLELANDVWRVTLSELKDVYRDHKGADWKDDPKLVELAASARAYKKTLGRLLDKLGNNDLSIRVNSKLKLKFEE